MLVIISLLLIELNSQSPGFVKALYECIVTELFLLY